MKPLDWLFEGWIPDDSLSLFAGDGGIGKSTFLVGLAAILSNGSDHKVNGGVCRRAPPSSRPKIRRTRS